MAKGGYSARPIRTPWRCASVVYDTPIRLRLRVNTTRPCMISSIWCYHSRGLEYCSIGHIDARQASVYMTVGRRPILLLLAGSLPAGLYAAALLLYS